MGFIELKKSSLISIIIPTFNRSHLLKETLDSVLAQTYTNWECIIVDDGSTDNTKGIIDEYVKNDNRFQYHKRPDSYSSGGNGARNYGFEQSKGDYIQWFDSDDVMLPDYLKTKVSAFTKNIDLVICSGSHTNYNLELIRNIDLKVNTFLYKDYAMWQLEVLTPSVLFRKSFLKDKSLFSTKIKKGQESEFFSRLFFKLPANKYTILNKSLFLYRQHDNSISKKSEVYFKPYAASLSFNYVANIKRAHALKDFEVFKYYYNAIIKLIFLGLKNRDKENILFMLKGLKNVLPFYYKIKLCLIIRISLLSNKRSYKLKRYSYNLIDNFEF